MRAIESFGVVVDIVVVGHNSEMADMDNPRGELYGFAGYVYAESARGDRWYWHVDTRNSERSVTNLCEVQAAALSARLFNRGLLPVGFETWVQGRPAYGSLAYELYGAADDVALERAEAEYA